ncbi:MAG: Rab family GTPase [Candidatus Hodarchaeota archaeon]
MTPDNDSKHVEKYVMKVVLLGDGHVGKTSLRHQYLGEQLPTTYMATIGADFAIKTLMIDGVEVKFNIWDLAGQPRFKEVRSMFFQGTNGAMFVYDLTNPESLTNLRQWKEELLANCTAKDVPAIVLGNKVDLVSEVDVNEAKKIAEEIAPGTPHLLTSALTGENVDLAFKSIGRRMLTFIDSSTLY